MSSESSAPHGDSLQIRCPQCGQRFTVAADLHGRMVECGACEHQFRIDEQTIFGQRKFYPGEKRHATPGNFSRMPHEVPAAQMDSVTYAAPPPANRFEPASPQQLVAGLLAILIFIVGILLLSVGTKHSGSLANVPLERRLLLAGFMAFVGSVFWVYANRRRRGVAMVVAMMLTGAMLGLPFIFRGQLMRSDSGVPSTVANANPAPSAGDSHLKILDQIDPLKDAHLRKQGGLQVHGLWLDGLEESHKMQVRDYVLRMTGADPSTHLYPRENSDYLMVIIGSQVGLDQLARICSRIGAVVRRYPEQALLEVDIDNLLFTESPADKLNDPSDRSFYALNKRELESIDLERARKAVQRLTSVPPQLLRSDILRLLLQLLGQVEPAYQGEVCRALMVWSEGEPDTVRQVAEALQKHKGKLRDVPRDMIAFLAKHHEPTSLEVMHELWLKDTSVWEGLYVEYGTMAEPQLLAALPKLPDVMQRHSAVRILHHIGTQASLPVLDAVRASANAELRALMDQAQTAIRERAKK